MMDALLEQIIRKHYLSYLEVVEMTKKSLKKREKGCKGTQARAWAIEVTSREDRELFGGRAQA